MSDRDWLDRAERSLSARGLTADLELLPPHASQRRYARATFRAGRAPASEIAMLFPQGDASDEIGGPSGEGVAGSAFAVVQRWLAERGVPVPVSYAADEHERVLWLQDLGGRDFDAHVSSPEVDRRHAYEQALSLLGTFQRATQGDAPALIGARAFDRELLRWELDHYVEWRLEAALELQLSEKVQGELSQHFEALAEEVAALPRTVVHRDFQSHNIMVVDGELVVIDFQDAMMGPLVYDAVALLRDSYVELDPEELDHLVAHFAARLSSEPWCTLDEPEVVRAFYLQTLQRKLKDAGRFVFIERVRGNDSFLRFIPSSLRYVKHAFTRLPEYAPLAELLSTLDPDLA